MLEASRQANTVKVYLGAYRRFEKWATGFEELSIFPSNPLAVTINVLSLIQMEKSISVIQQFLYAMAWIHRVGGFPNPTNDFMVHTVLDGAKRMLAKPTIRKLPMTTKIIKKMYKHFKKQEKGLNLLTRRFLAMVLIGFAGFLRCEEVLKIRRCDVAFHLSYVAIFIQQSKTDIYRNGRTILIARSGTSLDPVIHLFKYIGLAGIPDDSQDYIFRRISTDNSTQAQYLRTSQHHISYSTFKDSLKGILEQLGYDSRKYGTHSLRAGGATAAANHGVSDRLFKVHGRWKCEQSKDRYVQDSIHRRLKVTLNLGL